MRNREFADTLADAMRAAPQPSEPGLAASPDWIERLVRALSFAESLDGLLAGLIAELLPLLDAEGGFAGLRAADSLSTRFRATPGGTESFHHSWARGEGVPGWVLAHKRPFLSNEAGRDARIDAAVKSLPGLRSILCVPISDRSSEVIGFVAAYNKRGGAGFAPPDVQAAGSAALIAGLALQAHLALQAARGAERATRSYAESIRLLRDIAVAANTAADPQDALRAGIARICAYCNWPAGHAWLCDPDRAGRLLSTPVWYFNPEERYARLPALIDSTKVPVPGSLAVRALVTRQALWLPLTQGESRLDGDLETLGLFRATYSLPVWSGPDVVAVLQFFSTEDEPPNLARLDMLTQICALLGPVIVRGRTLEQVRAARNRLQQLSASLMDSHERERRRISLELHDQIGQSLTAIKLRLEALKAGRGDAARLDGQVDECIRMASAAMNEVRSLTQELRPTKLDDLGLVAAIRWLLDQQATLGGLTPAFHAEYLPERLPAGVETACYRIVQEALNNVLRHAAAKRVWVNLALHEHVLHLSVRDNGKGFDVDRVRAPDALQESLGLIGMEERAALVGGTLQVTSRPARGTRVKATIPIDPAALAHSR
jgi:signal transduction histidine kinase